MNNCCKKNCCCRTCPENKSACQLDIKDRVKTYEDAIAVLGRSDELPLPFKNENDKAYFEAIYKMRIIAEALNEGWKPNWDDRERKWRPWFVMSPSGFAFGDSDYGSSHAYAGCGSHICYISKELSDYSGKQFLDIWKKIQLG